MAEGYLRLFGKNHFYIYSAGIEAHGLNQNAVKVMLEDNIDISQHTSNVVSDYNEIHFDIVLTVCDNANERCPVFPNAPIRYHQSFQDPAKSNDLEDFRRVRDAIRAFSCNFIDELISK